MDRRKSLKLLVTGAVAGGALAAGCNTEDKKVVETPAAAEPKFNVDRYPEELVHEKAVLAQGKFFTDHEMATITVLGDIIIPKDDVSGSASDAKVPEFIDFIVRDMPQYQVPMQGGLRWMDMYCLKQYGKAFVNITPQQQIELVDKIAYPAKATGEFKQGAKFFSLMRNLTSTGFYTSPEGVKDVGYVGNTPTPWNGVPADVLKQYNLAYTEKELKECVSYA